jgi:hypothetical protein
VYRVRGLHPDFGYAGTPSFFRPCIVLVVCGLVAGAISFAVFKPEPYRDAMDAMALAPLETLIEPKPAQPAAQSEKRLANEPSAQRTDEEGTNATRKASSIKPTCRGSLGEVPPEGDCAPVRVVRMRPPRAVNERPLIAAVPIGHRDDPLVAASPPTPLPGPSLAVQRQELKVTPTPTETAVAEATPADTAPATEPTPPASMPRIASKQPRQRAHHASGRNHYSYTGSNRAHSSGYRYFRGGYASLW